MTRDPSTAGRSRKPGPKTRATQDRLAALDPEELRARVTGCLRLARWLARRQHRLSRTRLALEDLVQEANVKLMHAAAWFDPSRGIPFSAYAARAIKVSLYQVIARDMDRGAVRAEADLYRGAESGWTPYAAACVPGPVDWLADAAADLARLMDKADLTERDRLVITMRHGLFGQPPSRLEDVAERLDVTRQRVAQIESRAVDLLRRAAAGLKARSYGRK